MQCEMFHYGDGTQGGTPADDGLNGTPADDGHNGTSAD